MLVLKGHLFNLVQNTIKSNQINHTVCPGGSYNLHSYDALSAYGSVGD